MSRNNLKYKCITSSCANLPLIIKKKLKPFISFWSWKREVPLFTNLYFFKKRNFLGGSPLSKYLYILCRIVGSYSVLGIFWKCQCEYGKHSGIVVKTRLNYNIFFICLISGKPMIWPDDLPDLISLKNSHKLFMMVSWKVIITVGRFQSSKSRLFVRILVGLAPRCVGPSWTRGMISIKDQSMYT